MIHDSNICVVSKCARPDRSSACQPNRLLLPGISPSVTHFQVEEFQKRAGLIHCFRDRTVGPTNVSLIEYYEKHEGVKPFERLSVD